MKNLLQISKFLSLVLRHQPETIHLNMDNNGWVDIDELIHNANEYKHMRLDKEILAEIVKTNDKQRFIIDNEKNKIRANQGHSISIDLALEPQTPPDELFHGTAIRFLESIMENGIKPMSRQYVHLSRTVEIAENVGKRHGKPIVLYINSKAMYENGYKFYLSENKVWLVDYVPKEYIKSKNITIQSVSLDINLVVR
ncbi:MAG: RNA 2'-phosphotransferase [Treponema sp.]|nr:RNA 2'-phosphotransferase [Treponema sp.]